MKDHLLDILRLQHAKSKILNPMRGFTGIKERDRSAQQSEYQET